MRQSGLHATHKIFASEKRNGRREGILRLLRAALCALAAACILAPFAVPADASAPRKPANCRFERWMNTDYTQCYIKWDKVSGAKGYQVSWSWTNGTHKKVQTLEGQMDGVYYNVPGSRAGIFRVRAYKGSGSSRKYGPWSDEVYTVPSPTGISWNWAYRKGVPVETFKWNRVYGVNGYRIYLQSEKDRKKNGKKWYPVWTGKSSSSLKATISKYRGSRFKQGSGDAYKYYFRIVSLRRVNGKYIEAPMYDGTWAPGFFYFTK